MRRVTIEGTDLQVSRLSFGTSRLHHIIYGGDRQYLLAAAVDSGFTHFDTAPYYGFGLAELELGRFIKGSKKRITVATKFGLYPPYKASPGLVSLYMRKAAGMLLPRFSSPHTDWSVPRASESLELSLRRLGVERIDLLLLHEPESGALPSGDLLDWLTRERAKGRIRAWGLAGQADAMSEWIDSNHQLGMVLQVRDSLDKKEADIIRTKGRAMQLTFGYFSGHPAPAGPLDTAAVISQAMSRNTEGSILVSTGKVDRLKEFAGAVDKGHG